MTFTKSSLHTAVMQCGTLTLNNVHKTAIFNMDVCHSDPASKFTYWVVLDLIQNVFEGRQLAQTHQSRVLHKDVKDITT